MVIQIKVFQNSESRRIDKTLFSRVIDWDSSLAFPYQSTLDSLLILFGSAKIVEFSILKS